MEIIIGKTAGFCFGVNNAVTKAQDLLNQKRNIYCLGELVHNKQVTSNLEKNGLNTAKKYAWDNLEQDILSLYE